MATDDESRPLENDSPMGRRLQWQREAAERDEAYLAQGPADDTERYDSPWRGGPVE